MKEKLTKAQRLALFEKRSNASKLGWSRRKLAEISEVGLEEISVGREDPRDKRIRELEEEQKRLEDENKRLEKQSIKDHNAWTRIDGTMAKNRSEIRGTDNVERDNKRLKEAEINNQLIEVALLIAQERGTTVQDVFTALWWSM